MSELGYFVKKIQSAFRTPFDHTNDVGSGYTKETVQEALEEVGTKVENLTDKILTAEVMITTSSVSEEQYVVGNIISTIVTDNDGNIVTE